MPSALSNPLRLGLRQERVISPQCLIIFGASGDLTHRKLIPALFELYLQLLLFQKMLFEHLQYNSYSI